MIPWSRRGLLAGAAASIVPGAPARAAPAALRRGINAWPWFSLTREYPAPRTDYAWPPLQPQRPVPRAPDLQSLKAAGFDFIRIPVDPGPFLSFGGERRRVLLNELILAVQQGLAAGLSVLINVQANDATHFWNSARLIDTVAAAGFADYRGLVSDMATELARFDPARVALEPVNEPPQDCASGAWPAVQAALLTAARTAAPDLTLVATGACGSMVAGLEALAPASLPIAGPVLFTFHFYEPYLFTHQGAPWMREPIYRDLDSVPWPASAGSLEATLAAVRQRMARDGGISQEAREAAYEQTARALQVYFDANPARPFIDGYFDRVGAWAARNSIPRHRILLGEFGALRSDARHIAAAVPDRTRYVRDVREAAEAGGFGWAFWNLFDGMGLMDDATRAFDPAMIAALGLAMPKP